MAKNSTKKSITIRRKKTIDQNELSSQKKINKAITSVNKLLYKTLQCTIADVSIILNTLTVEAKIKKDLLEIYKKTEQIVYGKKGRKR
jgi:hypothetical protein